MLPMVTPGETQVHLGSQLAIYQSHPYPSEAILI